MTALSDFFKATRVARHVALTSVSGDRSPATVSRWENGLIDITSEVIGHALTPLGMDFEDLTIRHLVADVDDCSWAAVAAERWDRTTVAALRDNFQAQRDLDNDTPYTRFVIAMLNELLRVHDAQSQQLSPDIVALVTAYTQGVTAYGSAEGVLIEAAIEYAPAAAGCLWMQPLYDGVMTRPNAASLRMKRRLLAFGGVVGNAAVLADDRPILKQVLGMMADVLGTMPDDPIAAYNYNILLRLDDYLQDKSAANRQAVAAVIKTTQLIYPTGYFESFAAYAIAQDWVTAADLEGA
ncbi:hypothetical protein [Lacticaseibacillus parakribbianus]|uniref:hypothetical protein n=1 Tax=Lacticaseibacillus parakribbianus TaxID=2970927 RepID=UPI0021CB0217|nr:hypothetical protein [Lacticaseibacillus parakribbianus]